MPKSYDPPKSRETNYNLVKDERGEHCSDCGIDPSAISRDSGKPKARLVMSHVNGDRNDYSTDNVKLFCRSCFSSKRNRAHIGKETQLDDADADHTTNEKRLGDDDPINIVATTKCVCEKENDDERTGHSDFSKVLSRRREAIGEGDDGAIRARNHYLGLFDDWFPTFVDKVKHEDGVDPSRKEVLDSGSYATAASQATLTRYLDAATSREASHEQYIDDDGVKRIKKR